MGMPTSGTLRALIQHNILTLPQAQAISEHATSANCDIEDYLYYQTRYDSTAITRACARYFGIPLLQTTKISPLTFKKNSFTFLEDGKHAIASYKPGALFQHQKYRCYLISARDFYSLKQHATQTVSSTEQHTTIEKLDALLTIALNLNASDIHLEPFLDSYHIRLRIDGLLKHHEKISYELAQQINSRLKVLAKIDITQTRLPQDGHFNINNDQHQCDCRLSFCPTIWGEKIVIRLLTANRHIAQITELGLTPAQQHILYHTLQCTQGLLLVTGPTGSGKTQTLYTLLNHLNQAHINIVSIEDPVEIKLSGINQIQVNEAIRLSFAAVLRALLRQDPDVIMIGEIRDSDTAELAMRAAQTGHLVLATLHAQSAIEVISRLESLGISRYNMASTLRLAIAQRLVRRLQKNILKQRMALFELLTFSDHLRQAICDNQPISYLRQLIHREGFENLQQTGLNQVAQKHTTLDELKRVIDIDENAHV